MKIINLYGGPGTGKSSTAADLFAHMKWKGYSVELVDEYAKKATWEGHHNLLDDQLYMLAKQNRKFERLRDKVDWVVTDSPILLCATYAKVGYFSSFYDLVWDVHHSYESINIMLIREKVYDPNGRNQTEDEAREIDVKIMNMLIDSQIPYYSIPANPSAKEAIFEIISK